jgi:hypothetical protein
MNWLGLSEVKLWNDYGDDYGYDYGDDYGYDYGDDGLTFTESTDVTEGGAQTYTYDDGSTLTINADGTVSTTEATDTGAGLRLRCSYWPRKVNC